jgi:hypothetical protein
MGKGESAGEDRIGARKGNRCLEFPVSSHVRFRDMGSGVHGCGGRVGLCPLQAKMVPTKASDQDPSQGAGGFGGRGKTEAEELSGLYVASGRGWPASAM